MATYTGILDQVYRRTAALAKRKNDPDLAPNEDDLYILDPLLKSGSIWIAVKTGRLEADVPTAIVADQYEYDIHDLAGDGATPPTNVRKIRAVQLDQKFLDHQDGVDVLANCRQSTATKGSPDRFGVHRDKLVIYPIPTAEIATATPTMHIYYIMASAHTEPAQAGWSTTETPVDNIVEWLPVELELALVWYIMAEWFDAIAEFDLAREFRRMYEGRTGSLMTDHKAKRPSKTRRKPRWI